MMDLVPPHGGQPSRGAMFCKKQPGAVCPCAMLFILSLDVNGGVPRTRYLCEGEKIALDGEKLLWMKMLNYQISKQEKKETDILQSKISKGCFCWLEKTSGI